MSRQILHVGWAERRVPEDEIDVGCTQGVEVELPHGSNPVDLGFSQISVQDLGRVGRNVCDDHILNQAASSNSMRRSRREQKTVDWLVFCVVDFYVVNR